jgi:protocatechuate 3,4-dioxygenase beta subunit
MEPTTPENTLWEELSPNLDEALNQLSDDDRQAIVLRFFGRKAMRDVGAALGVSEDAAKMRVSRALDRMRTKLGVGGTVCTLALLESFLDERSVQAAPAQLMSRLAGMKLPQVAGAAGIIGSLRALLRTSRFNLATGAIVLAAILVSIVHLAQPSNKSTPEGAVSNSQADLSGNTGTAKRTRIGSSGFSTAPAPKPVKTFFHVVDSDSGIALADASIEYVYFGAAGMEEGHDLLTDDTGTAAIPEPDDATKTHGMNVFAVAQGHVPKSVNFQSGEIPTEYTMKLDPAMTASGWVVDEQGAPVPGVKIMIQTPGNKPGQAENIDFQTCPVTNRDDGSWSCSYVPRDYTDEIRFILKKRGYAVTLPVVPVSKVGLINLVLVISRGFTVTGHVMDPQNRPIADAHIKTLGGDSDQRQSAITDEYGVFSLEGVVDGGFLESPLLETNENGVVLIRGLRGIGPFQVDLAVQAEGFAPITNKIELHDVTNTADFTLSQGKLFRGRVIDEAGNPIANAFVQTDWNNQGERAFDWQTRTDADGRFEWDSAPEEPALFWFEADGYEWQRDVLLAADGNDHEIKLKRSVTK